MKRLHVSQGGRRKGRKPVGCRLTNGAEPGKMVLECIKVLQRGKSGLTDS